MTRGRPIPLSPEEQIIQPKLISRNWFLWHTLEERWVTFREVLPSHYRHSGNHDVRQRTIHSPEEAWFSPGRLTAYDKARRLNLQLKRNPTPSHHHNPTEKEGLTNA